MNTVTRTDTYSHTHTYTETHTFTHTHPTLMHTDTCTCSPSHLFTCTHAFTHGTFSCSCTLTHTHLPSHIHSHQSYPGLTCLISRVPITASCGEASAAKGRQPAETCPPKRFHTAGAEPGAPRGGCSPRASEAAARSSFTGRLAEGLRGSDRASCTEGFSPSDVGTFSMFSSWQ